ncbi:terpene synthase family protein [Streptomyces sp. UNOB3_S3]|uniref:terpene synthase family protein n=1 Tax=Streptomyces sp. UNOB3_S3 TaxID=2871682 RepID=UPI001E5ECF14|nr:terpene synthase family protein [Streptomyces sp. UNOB3_S3]MCC3778322.1 terpene synthase family protein [Streptomyces sp. UNOB3_S3]
MPKSLLFSESFVSDRRALAEYRVPTYTAPFPVVLNPHHEYAEEVALGWARDHGLDRTPAAAQRLADMACGMFAALYCPRTDREGLALYAKWIAWLFLWDDIFDDGPLGRDPIAFRVALAQVDRALAEPPGPPDGFFTLPLARALADIWRDFYGRAPENARRRFPASVRVYLRAMAGETRNRVAEAIPDLDSYLRLRRVNGATRCSIDMMEGLQGVDVPDSLRHGLYGELRAFASELWLWSNDTFTVRKDLHYQNPHNLVLVLCEARGLSLQDAAYQAGHMVEQRMRDFVRVAERLRELVDLPEDPHSRAKEPVLRGVRMLEESISGYFRWQETTFRYRRTSGFITP